MREELIAKLTGLGLTKTEARVYIALLENPNISAQQLSYVSRVQRTQIYGILRRLIDMGLIVEKQTEQGKLYESLPPETLVELTRKRAEALVEEAKNLFSELHELYIKRLASYEDSPEVEVIRNFKKAQELINKYLTELGGLKEMFSIIETPFSLPTNGEGAAEPLPEGEILTMETPSGEIGKMKILAEKYPGVIDDIRTNIKFRWGAELHQLDPRSFEIRLTTIPLKIRTIIAGNQITLLRIPEVGNKNRAIYLIVKNKAFAEFLLSLIEPIWEAAEKVPLAPPSDENNPSQQ